MTDDDESSDIAALSVTVNNVAPSVDAGPDAEINEGTVFSRTGSFTEPGEDTHTAIVNYGDGSGEQLLALNPDKTFTLSHEYADDGVFTVTATVTDNDGGEGSGTVIVTVNNVPPTVEAGPDQTVDEGETINFAGSFNDPGIADTHTIQWDFGDGGTASDTLAPTHIYDTAGTYTVTLNVTDDDGGAGSDILIVTVESGQAPPEQTIFNLAARAKSGKVQLTWSPVAGAQCYNVYRSTSSGEPYNLIADCHVTDYCTYLDLNVVNNTTYFYVVRSVANNFESMNSNEIGITPRARTRR